MRLITTDDFRIGTSEICVELCCRAKASSAGIFSRQYLGLLRPRVPVNYRAIGGAGIGWAEAVVVEVWPIGSAL